MLGVAISLTDSKARSATPVSKPTPTKSLAPVSKTPDLPDLDFGEVSKLVWEGLFRVSKFCLSRHVFVHSRSLSRCMNLCPIPLTLSFSPLSNLPTSAYPKNTTLATSLKLKILGKSALAHTNNGNQRPPKISQADEVEPRELYLAHFLSSFMPRLPLNNHFLLMHPVSPSQQSPSRRAPLSHGQLFIMLPIGVVSLTSSIYLHVTVD